MREADALETTKVALADNIGNSAGALETENRKPGSEYNEALL